MGRRSKAETLELVSRIVELYEKKHMTHEEIADYLQEHEGVALSREAVRRAYNKADARAEKYKLACESAKSIIEASKGTNTELAEAANSLVSTMFYERILKMDGLEFKDDSAFFKALAPVMNTQAKLAAARLDYENGRKKALDEVWDEISVLIGDDPKMLELFQRKFDLIRGEDE